MALGNLLRKIAPVRPSCLGKGGEEGKFLESAVLLPSRRWPTLVSTWQVDHALSLAGSSRTSL